MSEEKDMQEQFNNSSEEANDDLLSFVDLTDLGDLEDVGDLDLFGDLGDIADLGDIPDFTEEQEAKKAVSEEEELLSDTIQVPDDMPMDDSLNLDDMPMDDSLNLDDMPMDDSLNLDDMPMDDSLNLDDMPTDDSLPGIDAIAEGVAAMPSEDVPEISIENIPETSEENVPEMQEQDADSLLNDLGLDFLAEDAEGEETPLAVDEEASSGKEMDSMLDGLLDDFDMNGSLNETEAATPEEDGDPLADLLGLSDMPKDSEEALEDLPQDMLDVAGMIPEEKSEKEKKAGFFKRIFGNIVTDEIAQQEREAAQKAEEEAAQKEIEAAKAQEEKEAKNAEKQAEKEAKAAEKKKQKEAKKAEKEAKKAEKKAEREAEEEAELEIVGKLNKVGVSIIVIATIAFLAVEIIGTNMFGYASSRKAALNYFEMGKYTEAYKEAIGTDMRNKDKENYDKIKVVMRVQQCLNAYQNYDRIQYYPEALDALLRGIKRYDANIEEAKDLEVDADMAKCRTQILTILQDEFALSEQEAYSILAMEKDAYTDKVVELGIARK